jgi:hypothetical protein
MPVSVHVGNQSAARQRILIKRAVLRWMNSVSVVVDNDLEELRLDLAILAEDVAS